MPFPVKNLIERTPEPTTVSPDDDTLTALALMIQHDFSQLPVVDAERRFLGMVTATRSCVRWCT
jgi:CBS domain-containing protein